MPLPSWLKTLTGPRRAPAPATPPDAFAVDPAALLAALKSAPVTFGNWTWNGSGLPPASAHDPSRDAGDYRANSVVAIGLRWLRRNAMQGEIRVGTKDGKDYEEDSPPHPIIALLARPNPWQSPKTFLGGTYDALHVCGESFWLKIRSRSGGPPAELYWVPNYQIEVKAGKKRPISKYVYLPHDPENRREFDPWDVVHICYEPDPERPGRGTSPLVSQVRNIASLNVGERWSYAVLRRGHKGTVLVPRTPVYTGTPDEPEMLAAKRAMEEDISGEGAGGIHAVRLPMDALSVGLTPEEMAIDRILDRPEGMTLAAMGLTAHVVGLPSSADTQTYENTKTYNRMAWENGVIPVQDLVAEDGIQQQLIYATDDNGNQVAEWDDEPGKLCWWDRSEIAALKEDAESKATRAVQVWTNDIATHDEARQICDLEPVGGDEGDLFYSEWQQEVSAAAQPDPATVDPLADQTNPDPFGDATDPLAGLNGKPRPIDAVIAARNGMANGTARNGSAKGLDD